VISSGEVGSLVRINRIYFRNVKDFSKADKSDEISSAVLYKDNDTRVVAVTPKCCITGMAQW
jgi:hypothetical protein